MKTKIRFKIFTALWVVCLFFSFDGWASNLHLLSMEDGLSGISVNKIVKDHLGFVWIAAGDGIDMYNGNKVVSFDISVCGKPHNTVSDLCEVDGKCIYAITRDGIIMLEKGKFRFQPVLRDVHYPQCLFADGKFLYIGCKDGLLIFDGKHCKRIPMDCNPDNLSNSIRKIVKTADGRICFMSSYAIHWYHSGTQKCTHENLLKYLPKNVSLGQFAVEGNYIYIGTKNNGMFCYDQKNHKVSHFDKIGNVITSVYNSGNGLICVGTDGAGAYVIDTRSRQIVEHYGVGEEDQHRIPTNAVYEFFRDRQGVDWMGFARYGMAHVYHDAQLFMPFSFGDFTTLGLDVSSFCVRGAEMLIGTYHGFIYVDRSRNIVKRIEPQMMDGASIVTSIAFWRGTYYIGTYDGGMKLFNPSNLSVSPQHFNEPLNHANIADLQVAPDGKLWIGCSDGLYMADASGKVVHFSEQNSRVIGGTINSILFDKRNKIWI